MTMPRPKSANDAALNLLLPEAWLEEAQELARTLSQPGAARTRADVLRMAIRRGLDGLRDDHPIPPAPPVMGRKPATRGRAS